MAQILTVDSLKNIFFNLVFRWDNENDVDDEGTDEVDAENDKKSSDAEDEDGLDFFYNFSMVSFIVFNRHFFLFHSITMLHF